MKMLLGCTDECNHPNDAEYQRLNDTEQCPHHRTPTQLWQVERSVFPCTSFEVPPFLLEVSRKKYVDVW